MGRTISLRNGGRSGIGGRPPYWVEIRFEVLSHEPLIPRKALDRPPFDEVKWSNAVAAALVSDAVADMLESIIRKAPSGRGARTVTSPGASASPRIADDSSVSGLEQLAELETIRLATMRKEQSLVRKWLLQGAATGECVMCGNVLPAELLIAAHVKPRHLCNNIEKRDIKNNTALMCTLGCDALFERGLLSVRDGKVAAGSHTSSTAVRDSVAQRVGHMCAAFTASSKPYFDWRRNHASD
jgi:formamidopyrimidine-DNA glycosylase